MSAWDLPPAKVTNEQLYALLIALTGRVGSLTEANAELVERIDNLERDQKDMVDTWRAAGTLLKAIKLMGAVAAAIGLMIATFKLLWGWK